MHFRQEYRCQFEIANAGASNGYIVALFSVSSGSATNPPSTWYNAIDGKMVGLFVFRCCQLTKP